MTSNVQAHIVVRHSLRAVGPGNTFTNNAAVSAAGFQAILEGDRMALAAGTISAGESRTF